MQLQLLRGAPDPLHRQIETQIRDLIEAGTLDLGSRLPPSRQLALSLGVNRATVTAAYDALAAAGLVEARVGRGTEVIRKSGTLPNGHIERPMAGGPPDWASQISSVLEARPMNVERSTVSTGRLDFTAMMPDETLFPVDRLRRCLDEMLRRDGAELLQYGSPAGYEPFRALLAQRMRLASMAVDVEDVLVVNGAQQGLDLFCRALLDPGDAVAVESPTYANLLPVLRLHRAEPVTIPMTPQGLDLERLEAVLQSRRIKFLYTMPHFQNPTGITTTLAHRRQLIELTARYRLTILETATRKTCAGTVARCCRFEPSIRAAASAISAPSRRVWCPGFASAGWWRSASCSPSHLAQAHHRLPHVDGAAGRAGRVLPPRRVRSALAPAAARLPRAHGSGDARLSETSAADGALARAEGGYCLWVELPPASPPTS
jgi:DNA-binding transcriptional MocR family regulator